LNAAGLSPLRLFRPFLYAYLCGGAAGCLYRLLPAPDGMRRLKQWDAEITADVLANILQPGRLPSSIRT